MLSKLSVLRSMTKQNPCSGTEQGLVVRGKNGWGCRFRGPESGFLLGLGPALALCGGDALAGFRGDFTLGALLPGFLGRGLGARSFSLGALGLPATGLATTLAGGFLTEKCGEFSLQLFNLLIESDRALKLVDVKGCCRCHVGRYLKLSLPERQRRITDAGVDNLRCVMSHVLITLEVGFSVAILAVTSVLTS